MRRICALVPFTAATGAPVPTSGGARATASLPQVRPGSKSPPYPTPTGSPQLNHG